MIRILLVASLPIMHINGATIHVTGPDERQVEFGDGTTAFATLSGGDGFINSTVNVYGPDFVTVNGTSMNALLTLVQQQQAQITALMVYAYAPAWTNIVLMAWEGGRLTTTTTSAGWDYGHANTALRPVLATTSPIRGFQCRAGSIASSVIGLDSAYTTGSSSYTTLDFGFFPHSNGYLYYMYSGAYGQLVTYQIGDILQVWLNDAGYVELHTSRHGLIYTFPSAVSTYPLGVEVVPHDAGTPEFYDFQWLGQSTIELVGPIWS